MNPLTALYYWIRKMWFHLFPRKVGQKGWAPGPDSKLSAAGVLPAAPRSWTSPRLKWGMLGNGPDPANPKAFPNGVGDCVVAGLLHASMATAKTVKVRVDFSTPQAVAAYFALTGGPDSGLNPPGVLEEWESGKLPQPANELFGEGGPFVKIDPKNIQQLKNAIATFGWVGISVNLQQAQEDQFARGQRWNFVKGSPTAGGHFVVLTGFDGFGVGPYTVSWAKGFRSTWAFVTNLAIEACTGVLPPEIAAGGYIASLATLDGYCATLPGA